MRYSDHIKPISYLRSNTARIVEELNDTRSSMIITQNGEAKAVLQDIVSYEETQETLALLKILALGQKQIKEGKVFSFEDVEEMVQNLKKKEY